MPVSSPTTGTFAGMPEATLRAMLTEAQTALHALMTGRREVSVKIGMGDSNREVTYSAANMAQLRAWIAELNAALGNGRRRAIGVAFR